MQQLQLLRTSCQHTCSKVNSRSRCYAFGARSTRLQRAALKQPQAASDDPHNLVSSRRQLLQSCIASVLFSAVAGRSSADDSTDLERQLPVLPQQSVELPRAYQRTMHKLVKALQQSIEAEAAGAKEFEVRRKADGAKDLVKEFVGKWQDNAAVVGDITHDEMKGALSELGRFYQSKGPRARLNEETKQSVLAHLAAVEAALPEEEKSLLGF